MNYFTGILVQLLHQDCCQKPELQHHVKILTKQQFQMREKEWRILTTFFHTKFRSTSAGGDFGGFFHHFFEKCRKSPETDFQTKISDIRQTPPPAESASGVRRRRCLADMVFFQINFSRLQRHLSGSVGTRIVVQDLSIGASTFNFYYKKKKFETFQFSPPPPADMKFNVWRRNSQLGNCKSNLGLKRTFANPDAIMVFFQIDFSRLQRHLSGSFGIRIVVQSKTYPSVPQLLFSNIKKMEFETFQFSLHPPADSAGGGFLPPPADMKFNVWRRNGQLGDWMLELTDNQ